LEVARPIQIRKQATGMPVVYWFSENGNFAFREIA
jgi:hypothetical protein